MPGLFYVTGKIAVVRLAPRNRAFGREMACSLGATWFNAKIASFVRSGGVPCC
jgi:hypothetical protein